MLGCSQWKKSTVKLAPNAKLTVRPGQDILDADLDIPMSARIRVHKPIARLITDIPAPTIAPVRPNG